MTAAVGDYKLEKPANQKIQKTDQPLILKLQRTIDILAELGRIKEEQFLIGFAVQDRSARQNARRKMAEKNLDAIVLNSPASFGADRIDAQILQRGGGWENFSRISKKVLATTLVKLAEKREEKKKTEKRGINWTEGSEESKEEKFATESTEDTEKLRFNSHKKAQKAWGGQAATKIIIIASKVGEKVYLMSS